MGITKKLGEKISQGKIQSRPPIVVVLGHVDHGKTTLISKIYEKDLTRKEFGGISQHIGAYQVNLKSQIANLKSITFIDTPGHVAFSKMRSRGADVADLAVLVVAADEGVKPQTQESLKHIKEAKIPFLVAINKIDLPNVNLDWVKKNLAENGILVEGWGGDIVAVPVSAKTGEGIDELLEMILLLGEMAGIKADPQGKLEAVVIEAKLDPRVGPLATVLIRNGSLKVGEEIRAEKARGKIKAIRSDRGEDLQIGVPGQAVEILGFKEIPPVGAKLEIVGKEEEEKNFSVSSPSSPAIPSSEKKNKFKIVVKADTQGTLEAILGSLPEEVEVVFGGVGNIGESDVFLARTTGAELIGFNVKVPSAVEKLATSEGVKIKIYRIIYELLEEIEKKILKILEPTIDEEIFGQAEIVAEFVIKGQRIAGCRVVEGEIKKEYPLHLKRGEKILGNCRIISMKMGKEDIRVAKKGEEFGVILDSSVDFKIKDMLISFQKLPQ